MFSDAFAHDHQLLKTDPKHGLYLACGLIVRGNVEMSDIRRNIDRCAALLWHSSFITTFHSPTGFLLVVVCHRYILLNTVFIQAVFPVFFLVELNLSKGTFVTSGSSLLHITYTLDNTNIIYWLNLLIHIDREVAVFPI